jgi:hypothetical protein
MHKKLITICLALVALAACVVPATAQATNKPTLTHPTGTVLAVASKFTATNIGESRILNTTGSTQLTCTVASMTGEITKNETGNVQGNITAASYGGTGTGGACTNPSPIGNFSVTALGLSWCLKSTSAMATDEFQIQGGKCTEAPRKVKFLWKPSSGECEYESTSTTAFKGTFTTHSTGDAILTYPRTGHTATEDTGFSKIRDTTIFQICPTSIATQMSFTLETDTTTSSDPLYISE